MNLGWERRAWLAVAAVVLAGVGATSARAAATFLALGDSITFGVGADKLPVAPNTPEYQDFVDRYFDGSAGGYSASYSSTFWTTRGYRYYLQHRLTETSIGFDFVGNLASGHDMDTDHFGSPGANISQSWVAGSEHSRVVTSIVDALQNITRNTFSIGASVYDVSDKTSGLVAFNPAAAKPARILIHAGANDLNGDDPSSAILGFHYLINELFTQYQAGNFKNENAGFYIAKIIPKAGNLNATTAYNNRIETKVASWVNSSNKQKRQFGSRITVVDMQNIAMEDLDLAWLSRVFSQTEAALISLIDPTGDGWVDWFDGSSANTDLLAVDGIHPVELGYAVMGNIWSNTVPGIAARYDRLYPSQRLSAASLGAAGFAAVPEPVLPGWLTPLVLLTARRQPIGRRHPRR